MANSNLAVRMEKELLLLRRSGFMGVAELAEQVGVSEMTMRRDLRQLSDEGKVRMVYGGATPVREENAIGSYLLNHEKDKHRAEKDAIAREAVTLIEPNDVVLLDSGSTTEAMTRYLTDDDPKTILCYSLNIFEAVLPLMNSRVVITGGAYQRDSLIITGPEAVPTLQRYRVNKFFFGAGGLHRDLAVTCNSDDAVPIKRAMFPSSLERILLLDSSKFDRVTSYHLANFSDITTLITDDGIDEEYRDLVTSKGIRLLIGTTGRTTER